MSADSHRALVRRYIDEVWNGRQPAAPFFAPGFRRSLTATAPPLTGAEQQQRIIDFQAAFPGLHFTIEDLIKERGQLVVYLETRTENGASDDR